MTVRAHATVSTVLIRRGDSVDGVPVAELVALADGTLPEARRRAVETRVAASRRATAALAAQRRSVAATRAFAPAAPAGLEPRVRPAPRRWRPVAVAVCAGAAALALAIVLSPGGGLTVDAVAAVSARPAAESAPPPAREGVLRRSFEGVAFPDWDRAQGWRATGARREVVEGRRTDTVYYEHTHHRIGYTVVSGKPLGLPMRGRRVERNGVVIQLYRDGPRTVAVFERGGRTCVLAGIVHFEDTLIRLASWRADGALAF
jgi:hypothetical protein